MSYKQPVSIHMKYNGRIQLLLIPSPFCGILSYCADFRLFLFSPGVCWLSSICLENVIKTLSFNILIWQLEIIPLLGDIFKPCNLKVKNLCKYQPYFQYSHVFYPRDSVCLFVFCESTFSFHFLSGNFGWR